MADFTSRALIGREAALQGLLDAVDAAGAGRGSGRVLIGDAGVGKTRLAAEVARVAAERGLLVLAGRAVEDATTTPYRPLAEALASGFRGGLPRDRSVLALRPTLAHVVPEWSERPAAHTSVVAIAEAVLHLLSAAGRGSGCLLVVEDAHWADPDTLAVLEYLLDHRDSHPTCTLVSVRAEGPSRGWAVLQRLLARRAAQRVALRPLDDAEVEDLVRACLGSDAVDGDLIAFVRERADGLPFLVEELLAGLVEAGALVRSGADWQVRRGRFVSRVPGTLAESVARRLDALDADARDVLLAAALLGREIDVGLVARAAGQPEPAVLAALHAGVAAALLRGDGDRVAFRHALTREQIQALALPPRRRQTAGRALAAVTAAHPGLPGGWRDLAADLAVAAGRPRAAADHLVAAAVAACRRGAVASAEACLQRAALLVPDAPDVAVRQAEVRAIAGDVDGALALAARLRRAGHGGAGLDLALGRALLAAGRHGEADAVAAGCLAGDGPRALEARALRAEIAVAAGDLEGAERIAADLLAGGAEVPPAIRCQALEVQGRCVRIRDVRVAEQRFATALALAEAHDLPLWRARALAELGTIDLLDTMRTDRLDAARRAAVEAGAPAIAAIAGFHLASALAARDERAAAATAARRAAALAGRLGHAISPWAELVVARVHAQAGDAAAMRAALDRARAAAAPDERARLEAAASGQVVAVLALERGDLAAARRALDAAAALLRAHPDQHDPHRGLWALLCAVDPSAPVGHAAAARAEAAAAAGSDTRFNRALLRAVDAVAAGRDGDREQASAHLDAAVADLTGYHGHAWLLHLTRWLVAPPALADAWGRPVAWLQAGVTWFDAHDHPRLATSCRTLLREAGAAVPRRGRGRTPVPDVLLERGVTSREADVLALLGEHLSNRAIAERLVLSPRTVEKHVASLLRKTAAHDRAALARLAASLQPSPPPS